MSAMAIYRQLTLDETEARIERAMMTLHVQIVRFVEEHQPPIVEAQFFDSNGRRHTFVEKVAIFTADWLDASSKYPYPGAIRCEVLSQWRTLKAENLPESRRKNLTQSNRRLELRSLKF